PSTANARIRRFTRNPAPTRGSAARAVSGSKKLSCTRAQPGVLTTNAHTAMPKTRVETAAIATDFADCRRRKARRSSSSELGGGPSAYCWVTRKGYGSRSPQGGHALLGAEPLGDELVELAAGAQRVDRRGHPVGERAALGEHDAPLVGDALDLGEGPDDDAAVELDAGHVERGRH